MLIQQKGKIEKYMMFIHWKSLIAFGLLFWFLLCATDILGGNPRGYLYNVEDYDLLYETIFMERLQSSENVMIKLRNFGALLLLWNFVTFVCSMVLCQLAKSCWWILFNTNFRKTVWTCPSFNLSSQSMRSVNTTISKIPVKIKPMPLTSLQVLELKKRLSLKSDVSCPNFLRDRTCSNLSDETTKSSPKFHTLFKNNRIFVASKEEPFERIMDTRQITKLRAEIIRLQSKSQKEQSELSRKIDSINREKKEISKQLSTVQKENRAAKQQIEELAQEKAGLLKKMETATRDIKFNTKSKKAALTKLEELTFNSEKLKQELEQVSRDKDILENKLKVLQCEYEKLQERIILPTEVNFCEDYHVNTPERDTNNKNLNNPSVDKIENKQSLLLQDHEEEIEQVSVSQTELDMKNIQVKIKQLEKNLENFNAKKPEFAFPGGDQGDSELTLNMEESKGTFEDYNETYDYFFPSATSPTLRYWSGRAGDVVRFRPSYVVLETKSQNTNVIQTIASKVNEKVRLLDNIRETYETEIDEYSSHESLDDIKTPRKIVSSSVAFQKFLKNLQPDSSRLPYDSQSEYCF